MKSNFTTPAARALALAALLALPALATAQNVPLERALQVLNARRATYGLNEKDLANPAVTSQYTDTHNGVTHLYLRQRHQGIEVHGAVADVHLSAAGKVVSLSSSFVPNVASLARNATPSLSAVQAVAAAARALNMPAPRNLQVEKEGSAATGIVFNEGGISLEKISVKLMYQPLADGSMPLAWDVTLAPLDAEHFWNVRVDAASGALLDKTDYTIQDSFGFTPLHQTLKQRAAVAANAPTPVVATANRVNVPNSYNVWPITVESPSHGARQLVVNPADATYSPFGWHDTDGVAGAEFTRTNGNNANAYDDRANRNVYFSNSNVSPDGGANLEFDFSFNNALAATPTSNLNAAIVNLFYWNNMMHDVMAYKGFNEVSGNFQLKNYSNTGLGSDAVLAEAQDGAAAVPIKLNNANFSTPVDGTRPRMQMYLWDKTEQSFTITAPSSIAGPITAAEGSNGRTLAQVGPITGNVVLVNDGSAVPARGCNPLVNAAAVSGNIALIQRGKCNFSAKIKIAQNAGARMVIMMDSIPNSPLVNMAGTAPDSVGLRIPSIFITKADGDRMKAALAAGQTVTFSAISSVYYRDGDFDNGIVAHEYGHGISTRLTGGPANSSCLNNAEQMGEGWSDFFALWMTTKPGDVGTTGRGIGTYAVYEATTGDGIRSYKYSTDMTVNPLTYANIGVAPYNEVHYTGEVWAAVLWDLNWALINRYGYNADLKATTGGNNIALQLVLDGCKLQKCSPGFLDGRDAILKADSLNNNHANAALIWSVFARRGMGFSAVQGSSNSLTDQVAAYNTPRLLSTQQQLNEKLLDLYPNPANNQVLVRTQVGSSAPVQVTLLSMLGQQVHTELVPVARMQQEGVTLNTANLAAGVYIVRLTTSEGNITKKVVVQH